MKRILSTSALTILLASGTAYAQTAQGTEQTAQGTQQTAQGGGEVFANVPADPSMLLGTDYIGQSVYSTLSADGNAVAGGEATTATGGQAGTATDAQATTATGEQAGAVDNAAGAEQGTVATQQQPENVGEISDIIMTQDGQVQYVILGVGGFLGIGQRDVAVNFDALSVQPDPQNEGEMMIMISATQDEIENAPEFDRSIVEGWAQNGQAGNTGNMQSTQTGTVNNDANADNNNMTTIEADTQNAGDQQAAETEMNAEGNAGGADQAAETTGQAGGNAADGGASASGQAGGQTGDAGENANGGTTTSN